MTSRKISKQPHHVQQDLCTTRAAYRQGRKLTAVKVYTVNDESNHLLIYGVPSIGLIEEVTRLCRRYGDIRPVEYVEYDDKEEFTDVFHVTFKKVQAARFAKKQIDTKNFFGKILHVFYAPELETLAETRNKLITRRKEVAERIYRLENEKSNQKIENTAKRKDYRKIFETPVLSFSEPSCQSSIPNLNQYVGCTASCGVSHSFTSAPEFCLSDSGISCSVTTTNPSCTADFYKMYDRNKICNENVQIFAEEISKIQNSNPYKIKPPFSTLTSLPGKKRKIESNASTLQKTVETSLHCFSKNETELSSSKNYITQNRDKQSIVMKYTSEHKPSSSNNKTITNKLEFKINKMKFIPRQLIRKK